MDTTGSKGHSSESEPHSQDDNGYWERNDIILQHLQQDLMENSLKTENGKFEKSESLQSMTEVQNEITATERVLRNTLIFGKILSCMNIKDLLQCRRVEKSLWHSEATKHLKRRGMIHFNGPYDEEDEEQPRHDVYLDLPTYLREMADFQLESFSLGRGFVITEQEDEYETFFQKYGSKIKHLRMDYYYDTKVFRNILQNYVPNLETLDIRILPDGFDATKFEKLYPTGFEPRILHRLTRIEIWNNAAYPRRMGTDFVNDIFRIAPNINSVNIVDRYYVEVTKFSMAAIHSNPKLIPNITKLELDCCGSPTVEDLKIIAQMKLRVLHLGVIYELTSPEPFQLLLNSQCKTLQDLQFSNIKVGQPFNIQLPRFEKLSRLELTTDIPNGQPFGFSFGIISYAETFPNLRELSNCRSKVFNPHDCIETSKTYSRISPYDGKKFFTGMTGLWNELFPRDGPPFPRLVTLDIPFPKKLTESTNNKFFYRLADMFPNVDNKFFSGLRNGTIKIEVPKPKKKPKKGGPIGVHSVYVLVENIQWDVLPDNVSVMVDYGFINCKTLEEQTHLFSVYTAIIKLLECNLEDLHEACIHGKLAEFITEQYTAANRTNNYYYEWFLKNSHLVRNPYPIPDF